MKIFWVIHYPQKTDATKYSIKSIRIDTSDYSAKEMKDFIYKAFDMNPDSNNIRLRNCQDNLVPINRNIEANTKKDPYILEVYRFSKAQRQKQNELLLRPVTRRPESRTLTAFATQNLVNVYLSRLNKIEDIIDRRQSHLKETFHAKISEIESQVNYIEIQINKFENFEWVGFLKRPVLW